MVYMLKRIRFFLNKFEVKEYKKPYRIDNKTNRN